MTALFHFYALDGVGLTIAEDENLIVADELARSNIRLLCINIRGYFSRSSESACLGGHLCIFCIGCCNAEAILGIAGQTGYCELQAIGGH